MTNPHSKPTRHATSPCFWCDYDLRNTTPDLNCPECGIPSAYSKGHGILHTLDHQEITQLHKKFKRTLGVAMALILYIIIAPVAMIVLSVIASYSNTHDTIERSMLFFAISLGVLILTLESICWWTISKRLTLPSTVQKNRRRIALRISLIAQSTALALFIGLSVYGITQSSPLLFESSLQHQSFYAFLIALLCCLTMQMLYINWYAQLLLDRSVMKLSLNMTYLTPIIMTIGCCLLFIGPLVVFALRIDMLYHLKRRIADIEYTLSKNSID